MKIKGLLLSTTIIVSNMISASVLEFGNPQIKINVSSIPIKLKAAISKLNEQNCESLMTEIGKELFLFRPSDIGKLDSFNKKDPNNIFSELLATRIMIHQTIKDLVRKEKFQNSVELEKCVKASRLVTRGIREQEDYWGMYYIDNMKQFEGPSTPSLIIDPETKAAMEAKEDEIPRRVTKNEMSNYETEVKRWKDYVNEKITSKEGYPFNKINPQYAKSFSKSIYDGLESGDIFTVRGMMFTGGVIGRVGDVDHSVGHTAVYYVHEGPHEVLQYKVNMTKEKSIEMIPGNGYIIEAVFDGTIITPINEWFVTKHDEKLSPHHTRFMVYRLNQDSKYSNSKEVAAAAAKNYFQRLKNEKYIDYNFSMNSKIIDEGLFCSQGHAWSLNSTCQNDGFECEFFSKYQNRDDHYTEFMPLVRTKFNTKNGIAKLLLQPDENGKIVTDTYSPGDIELDPRYDLVWEHTNLDLVEGSRMQDMGMTKLNQWMEDLGYDTQFVEMKTGQIKPKFALMAEAIKQAVVAMEYMPPDLLEGFIIASPLCFFILDHQGPGKTFGVEQFLPKFLKSLDLGVVTDALIKNDHYVSQDDLTVAMAQKFLEKFKNEIDGEEFSKVFKRVSHHMGLKTFLKRIGVKYQFQDPEKNPKQLRMPLYAMDRALEYFRVSDCKKFMEDSENENNEVFIHDIFNNEGQCSLTPIYLDGKVW